MLVTSGNDYTMRKLRWQQLNVIVVSLYAVDTVKHRTAHTLINTITKTHTCTLSSGTLSATSNPLTTITVGAMADLGYTVSYATADSYDELVFNARRKERSLKQPDKSIHSAATRADANTLSLRYDPVLDPPKPLPKMEDRMTYLMSLQVAQAQEALLAKQQQEVPNKKKAAPKKKTNQSNRKGH
jgi:hypothetical protein